MDTAAEEAFGKILTRISKEGLKHPLGEAPDEPKRSSRSSSRRRK
jgi:hypothetical protein